MPKLLQNLLTKEIQVAALLILYIKLDHILRNCDYNGGLCDLVVILSFDWHTYNYYYLNF